MLLLQVYQRRTHCVLYTHSSYSIQYYMLGIFNVCIASAVTLQQKGYQGSNWDVNCLISMVAPDSSRVAVRRVPEFMAWIRVRNGGT